MINWTSSMTRKYEFYTVDPITWKDDKPLDCIEKCSITRDLSSATLGSATIDTTELMGECYIRVYLVVIQNGLTQRVPLGTFLVQTPSVKFDGKTRKMTMDAYTSLIELKGTPPPLGYALMEGDSIMNNASRLCRENMRAPVVPASNDDVLSTDFISNLDDTWLTFITDLISNAKYSFSLDELGRVLFSPEQDTASLQPVWTYDDGNSSILYPDITDERDLFNVPNVVEVIYSTSTDFLYSKVVNDDPDSPVSTVSRGRSIVYRDSAPSIAGNPTQEYLDEYAKQLLRNLSCLEHKITYKHGYCDVKIGDCIMLNYQSAGLSNIKAKVISQSITCDTGCSVEETAVYTENLWR